jgi:co-chaperonin GroES (HSP10)
VRVLEAEQQNKMNIEAEIIADKELRRDTDAIIQRVKSLPQSRERSLTITKLQEGVSGLRPLGNWILVRRFAYEQAGGIWLTEKARMDFLLSRPQVYRVLALGPGKSARDRARLAEIEVGDRVICYSETSGPLEAGEKGLFMVDLGQVLIILKKPVDRVAERE